MIVYLMQITLVWGSLAKAVYSYNISSKIKCRINKDCNDCKVISTHEFYSNVTELIVAAIENNVNAVNYLIGKKTVKMKVKCHLKYLFQVVVVIQITMKLSII